MAARTQSRLARARAAHAPPARHARRRRRRHRRRDGAALRASTSTTLLVVYQALDLRRSGPGLEPAGRLRRPGLAGAGGLRRHRHVHGRRARQSLQPLGPAADHRPAASSPACSRSSSACRCSASAGCTSPSRRSCWAPALGVFMVNWNGLGGAVGLFLTTYAPSASRPSTTTRWRSRWPRHRDRLRRPAHATRPEPPRHPRRRGHRPGDRRLDLPHQALGVGRVVLPHRHGRRPAGRPPRAPWSRTARSRSTWTINIVSTTIVGGIGTIVGPIIGAGFTAWLGEALSGYPEIHVAITGVIVILIIRFAPAGIWGIAVSVYERLVGRERAGARPRTRQRTEEQHATRPSLAADGPRLAPSGEAGRGDAEDRRHHQTLRRRRGRVRGRASRSAAARCSASSAPTAPARARSSAC